MTDRGPSQGGIGDLLQWHWGLVPLQVVVEVVARALLVVVMSVGGGWHGLW